MKCPDSCPGNGSPLPAREGLGVGGVFSLQPCLTWMPPPWPSLKAEGEDKRTLAASGQFDTLQPLAYHVIEAALDGELAVP